MRLHLATILGLSLALTACGSSEDPSPDPDPAPTGDGNDTFETATPLTLGTPATGTISQGSAAGYPSDPVDSDPDYFTFMVPAGGASIRFRTFDSGGAACGDPVLQEVDPHLDIYDGAKILLATDYDSAPLFPSFCEDLTLALSEGPHYVRVRGWPPVPFGYTLSVTEAP